MKKIITTLSIAATLFACKKDETTKNTTTKTKTQLLTQKSWNDSLIYSRTDTTKPWAILNPPLMPCQLDDITTFTTANTYTIDEGTVKCYSNQIVETGTWAFTNNEANLQFVRNLGSAGTQTQDWKILQLDENIFSYQYYYPSTGPYYKVIAKH